MFLVLLALGPFIGDAAFEWSVFVQLIFGIPV